MTEVLGSGEDQGKAKFVHLRIANPYAGHGSPAPKSAATANPASNGKSSEHYSTYDAENRIISAVNSANGTSTYLYNADGQRIRKTTGSTSVDFLYDFQPTSLFNTLVMLVLLVGGLELIARALSPHPKKSTE